MSGLSCYGPLPKTAKSRNSRVSGKQAYMRQGVPPAGAAASPPLDVTSTGSTSAPTDSASASAGGPAPWSGRWVVAMDMGKHHKGDEVKLNGSELMHGKHAIHILPNGEKVFIEQLAPARVRLLVTALDYAKSERPLACTTDAQNVLELARQCGVEDTVILVNDQCTREAVLNSIREMGARCGDDDYFVFYFAGNGHGSQDGVSERGGLDEAFILSGSGGQEILTDNDFSSAVADAFPKTARILLLMDCSCCGTITDMAREKWQGRDAVAMTGCLSAGHALEDARAAGTFTHCLLLALDKLGNHSQKECSTGMVFNALLEENEAVFGPGQDLVIEAAPDFQLDAMAWPLIPPPEYQAPFTKLAALGGEVPKSAMGLKDSLLSCACNSSPEAAHLKRLGISPGQMVKAKPGESATRRGDEYLARVQGRDLEKGSCTVQ